MLKRFGVLAEFVIREKQSGQKVQAGCSKMQVNVIVQSADISHLDHLLSSQLDLPLFFSNPFSPGP